MEHGDSYRMPAAYRALYCYLTVPPNSWLYCCTADELDHDDSYHMPTAYDDEKGREKKYEVLTQRYRCGTLCTSGTTAGRVGAGLCMLTRMVC